MSQKLEYFPIDQITSYERNARIHGSSQIDQLASIIDLVGFLNPVVIDKKNIIIAGHGRRAGSR